MAWKSTLVPKRSVVVGTGNCDFIFLPEGNCFEGALIRFPKKLVRQVGGRGNSVSISYADGFEFPLFYMANSGDMKRAKDRQLTSTEVDAMFAETHRRQFQTMRGLR